VHGRFSIFVFSLKSARPIAPEHSPVDARGVSRAESLDRKVLAQAFLRAQQLSASSSTAVDAQEALQLEETLRPLASAAEIRQVVVPLLDRAQLFGLAMAWDSGAESKAESWLLSRVNRLIALSAPEFAFITMCELNRANAPVAQAFERAEQALQAERAVRLPILEQNLSAVQEIDAELAHQLERTHRTSVALRPLGAGLAEFAGPGQPWVQLWAVTPTAAFVEAERLVRQCSGFADGFIAGVGDCSLPALALTAARQSSNQRIHIVDLQISRVRALLEVLDLSRALRDRSVWLHAGPHAVQTLAPFAARAFADESSVVGGDSMAVSLLRAAAEAGTSAS
jgi:hypothetical protein